MCWAHGDRLSNPSFGRTAAVSGGTRFSDTRYWNNRVRVRVRDRVRVRVSFRVSVRGWLGLEIAGVGITGVGIAVCTRAHFLTPPWIVVFRGFLYRLWSVVGVRTSLVRLTQKSKCNCFCDAFQLAVCEYTIWLDKRLAVCIASFVCTHFLVGRLWTGPVHMWFSSFLGLGLGLGSVIGLGLGFRV